MKLVCVPRNIYENINKACQAMTPHDEGLFDIECICTRTVFNVVSMLLLVTSNGALAESSILKHLSLTQ
jgi:hypothetical protein